MCMDIVSVLLGRVLVKLIVLEVNLVQRCPVDENRRRGKKES